MKKFLLSLLCLLTMATTAMATDTYRLVTSADDLTPGSSYILYGGKKSTSKFAIMSADVSTTSTKFMNVVTLTDEPGETIDIEGNEGYAILELRVSEYENHEGHFYFYITNEGKSGYLSNMPGDKRTLQIYQEKDVTETTLNNFHVTIDFASDGSGDAEIRYYDSGKNSLILYNTSTSPERFTGYENPSENVVLPRLYKLEENDPDKAPSKPVFTPTSGNIYDDDPILISGKGTIYYTLEDIDLTPENGIKYTDPFTISQIGEVTVKAIVVSATGLVSDVATVKYHVSESPLFYTIVFKDNGNSSGDGSNLSEDTPLSEVIEEGIEYVNGFGELENATYNSWNGLKLGTGSKTGGFTIYLDKPVLVTEVVINASEYNVKDKSSIELSGVIGVNGKSQDFGTQQLDTDEVALKDYIFSGIKVEDEVTALTLNTDVKRAFVKSITIKYRKEGALVDEVPVPEVEGNFTVDGDCITGDKSVKINFKALEGHHIYYSLTTNTSHQNVKAEATTRAACTDEHAGFKQHAGEEITLSSEHSALSFFACNPETGAHSAVKTYNLSLQTGVAEIEIGEGEAVYYGLEGQKMSGKELAPGVYIRVKDGKAKKVIVK